MAMPQYNENDESNPDVPEGGTDPTTEGTPATEGGAEGRTDTMFIHPDMLGGLDPESINPGDVLEFKVVGRDADGDIEVEYNTGDDKSPMEKVTSDFREHMAGDEGGGNPDSGGY